MIRIRDLSVTLGGRLVLDRFSLAAARGDSIALVGPNGAGKTTVLRCLVGLLRHGGAIEVGGFDAAREPVAARALIGYMPQVPAFCEETARGALAFLAKLRSADAARIDPLLARVGLLEQAGRRVRTFSTGMKQRLSLAAALLGDPAILVLDEPTASLDLAGQREIIGLLQTLHEDGRTILMSSHRTEEIRALARRVVVLDEGRIVDDRPVAGLPERDPSDLGPGPVRSRRREPDAALDLEAIA